MHAPPPEIARVPLPARRPLPRLLLLLLTVTALAAAIQYGRFVVWRRAATAGLAEGSRVLETSRGAIEYTVMGDGVPVLWLHGNPGGYDQLSRAFLVRPEFGAGLRSIVVSRPGYLRTPLSSGATPEEQARLFAALLDSLGVAKVAVVGVSGGGPAALQFARMFPQRTQSLALVFAVTQRIPPDPVGRKQRLITALGLDDMLIWRIGSRLDGIAGLDTTDTAAVRSAQAMLASLLPRTRRRAGDENDQRQFDRLQGWPIDGITAPTLVLAGTEDQNVPISHAAHAKERIRGARVVMLPGDHNAQVTRAREVWGAVRAFVLEQARR